MLGGLEAQKIAVKQIREPLKHPKCPSRDQGATPQCPPQA